MRPFTIQVVKGFLFIYVCTILLSSSLKVKFGEIKEREGEKEMKNKKIWGVGLLVVIVAAFAIIYGAFSEKPVEGSKAITIEVINQAGDSKEYEVKTDAEFLMDAVEEVEDLEVKGQEGAYGLMIESVNGEKAIYEEDGAYWSITVNGEYGMNGIDTQPIEDGDEFQLVYTMAE